jgi:hypothetical protein
MNPLAVSQSGVQVPGANSQPYPQLGPAQGGVGAGSPGAPPPGQEGDGGGTDKLSTVLKLAMAAGVKSPDDLGNFLKGLGFQTAARLARPKEPRGITDDPLTGPGGAPTPPPMPPQLSAAPMPPGPGV